jgi:pSer/pThr/pTyr-binding forkhead associated (FHA) protein
VLNKTYQLIVRKGPNEGQEFPLTSDITTIGRDPMADISLNDPEISRLHARLSETAVGYELEDLGSTNGTYVDGQLIAGGPAPLRAGQEIQLGSNLVLTFAALETSAAAAPAELEDVFVWAEAEVEDVVVVGETAVSSPEPPEPIEATAVEEEAGETEETDPMLPPSFEDLPAFDDSPAYLDLPEIPAPDKADLDLPEPLEFPEFPELKDEPIIRHAPPPPPKVTPRVVSNQSGAPPPKSGGLTTGRVVGILAGILALMMCCCCGLLIFMWQWGGDWLLRQMQLIP